MTSISTIVFSCFVVIWMLASTNSALEELVCFQLPVTVENGEVNYHFDQTPNSVTVKLECPKNQYVQLRMDITYMVPKYNVQVAGGYLYCSDLTTGCKTEKPTCTCCSRKQYANNHFCNKTLTMSQHIRGGCDKVRVSSCDIQVERIEINDECLQYNCRENNIQPYSWCYARWVAINYDCVIYNPGNKCLPNPCGDHGTCKTTIDNYACECDLGYTGQHCEYIGCTLDTCLNRGSCVQVDNLRFNCNCRPGYSGSRCETYPHDCGDTPCENGGRCVEYKCVCKDGFTGKKCGTKKNTFNWLALIIATVFLAIISILVSIIVYLMCNRAKTRSQKSSIKNRDDHNNTSTHLQPTQSDSTHAYDEVTAISDGYTQLNLGQTAVLDDGQYLTMHGTNAQGDDSNAYNYIRMDDLDRAPQRERVDGEVSAGNRDTYLEPVTQNRHAHHQQ